MVNSGEPIDGSGRVCIHLFVQSDSGPFVEPHVLRPIIGPDGNPVKGKLTAAPTRGMLACDPSRSVAPVKRDGVIVVTHRTDDPRAVTCPKCKQSIFYREKMELLAATAE